jgi:glycosyltransferase involved in cell wall biosynthesis
MERMGQSYEIVFVNDGSTDSSLDILKSINFESAHLVHLVIVNLNKHSGQSIAMQAGLDAAGGELIITMDGDLQNVPEDIPKLLDKLNEGYDVVCGWRYNRKDPWDKVFISKIASVLRRILTKESIHDFGCTLRIFKKDVLKNVYLSAGMHRFFTLVMSKLGYKVAEVKVKHHPRRFGRSKYNIHNRLLECLIDSMRISLFDIRELMKRKSDYQIREVIRR